MYCQQAHEAGDDILYMEPIESGEGELKTMDWDIPLPKANGHPSAEGLMAQLALG